MVATFAALQLIGLVKVWRGSRPGSASHSTGKAQGVGGIQVAFRQTIGAKPGGGQEKFFHRITIEDFRFDTVSAAELAPDPALAGPGDKKPGDSR